MKTYDEMANNVLRRIGEYETKQKHKRKILTGTVVSLGCVCLAVLVSIGARQNTVSPAKDDGRPVAPSYAQAATDLPGDENYSVFIPALELPDFQEGMAYDMLGLVVYKGNIYTQAGFYDTSNEIRELVGDYLGYATGKINEWSSQDDYAEEFASTYTGDVYSVKGYSTDFRICIVSDEYIEFMENLNGIGLNTGEDLFGDRLKIKDRITSVRYQNHYDWDNGNHILQEFPSGQDEINAFIDDLYSGEFEYVYEKNLNFYDDATEQAHLYLYLEDGTTVELRLFEGGYVGYQNLGWYFVKMPGSAFDTVFNACK